MPQYPVYTMTPGHKIVRANKEHECFGVPHRARTFWVQAVSPICTGQIERHVLHLEFDNPLTRLQAKACLACVLHYDFSQLDGELAQFKPLTEEALEQARVDLEADVADLMEEDEPVGRIRPLRPLCPSCGTTHDW